MPSVDDATQTQIRNIETSTGRSLAEWTSLVTASGHEKHGDIVGWLKSQHGFSHGNANLIALQARRGFVSGGGEDPLGTIYAGPKAALRAFHEQVIELATAFGGDVELAPKQAYVSLRRSKQFATVGPASGGRLEIGLNLKGEPAAGRLEPTSGMCTHRVRLSDPTELDDEVRGWLRAAYDRA